MSTTDLSAAMPGRHQIGTVAGFRLESVADIVGIHKFCEAVLGFLRRDVPTRWSTLCDSVTDSFRIISPEDFRVLR
jgi:hypothetical protein